MGDFKTVRQISYANKTPYNFLLMLEYLLILQLFLTYDNQIQIKLNKAFLNIPNFSCTTNEIYILFFFTCKAIQAYRQLICQTFGILQTLKQLHSTQRIRLNQSDAPPQIKLSNRRGVVTLIKIYGAKNNDLSRRRGKGCLEMSA